MFERLYDVLIVVTVLNHLRVLNSQLMSSERSKEARVMN